MSIFLSVRLDALPKFTSYWRGPFKVLAKLSEVLYKVNCGRKEKEQVIHCDRMKACRKQLLRGETEPEEDKVEKSEPEKLDANNECELSDDLHTPHDAGLETVEELAGGPRSTRPQRPPRWLKDYVQE